MLMNLHICQTILNKVNYFLGKFPSKEWSGPAWYLIPKVDEHKFPVEVELLDFHPLDLGTSAATEWESDDFAKILKEKYKENKKLKKCYIGLLHSHHDMGAFFSGTDQDTIYEMAPDNGFYPSTVVSTKDKKEYAFAIGYKDQYNRKSMVEGDVTVAAPIIKVPKEWKAIADKIKANNTKISTYVRKDYNGNANPNYHGYGWGGYGQAAIWDKTEAEDVLTEEVLQEGRDLWSKYRNPENTMDYNEMCVAMKKLGIENPYGIFGGSGWRY